MRLKLFLASLLAVSATTLHADSSDYEIVNVEKSDIGLNVSIAGTVTAFKTVQLTAQIPARVLGIYGREGDTFAEGSVLVQLDDSALLARREAAYAAREAAVAAIQNAQAQLRREYISPRSDSTAAAPGGMGMPAMMDEMFSSPMQGFMGMRDDDVQRYSDMISMRTGVAQAQTQLRQADANILEIEAKLRDTRSVAPFAGVVENVYVEVGDPVQPGQPLVNYSESGQYKVEADLPVHLVRGLKPGQKLSVSLDNNSAPVDATVYRIYPAADLQRHTVRVEFTLPPGTSVTSGQYAELKVPDTSSDIPAQLTIPSSAVVSKGGMALVFAVDPEGAARLRVVRLGEDSGNRVVVLSGVKENDEIVANPPPGLRAGTQVKNTEPATEPAPAEAGTEPSSAEVSQTADQ
jgi:multidrug efflux pump subunit AcrA (membrane-fusion protein)